MYELRRRGTAILMFIAIIVVGFFLYAGSNLVKDLAAQERSRMQIWADATREIVSGTGNDVDFPLSIIESNQTIPVLLTDSSGSIISYRNFDLPETTETSDPTVSGTASNVFLLARQKEMADAGRMITIMISPDYSQYLYYDESSLLKRLSYYPYVQIAVMAIFVFMVYYAVSSTRRAEQNKVWIGLSKETAHQLGTPLSSLMAWIELLPDYGVNNEIVNEMSKDINRLSSVASRFGKIGSRPRLDVDNMNEVVSKIAGYMSSRISGNITINTDLTAELPEVMMSAPLIEWVLENLIKNAADAIDGHGTIALRTSLTDNDGHDKAMACITVTDTGRGMTKRIQKAIFEPGFTTKERGWGLGLTLARRIVEDYHHGHIYVSHSRPEHGTEFTILLPITFDNE